MRFRAIVVMGNRKGKVGLGTGKATEVQAAVRKAQASAKRNMIRIPIVNGTIPHAIEKKFKAARIRIMPAYQGTGIIAGGALRVILDHAGVKDCLSKRFGSRNKLVNAQTTMLALKMLRAVKSTPEAVEKGQLEVKEISKEAMEKQRDIHRKGKIE
jgi:small subunit ribosomal protein S5